MADCPADADLAAFLNESLTPERNARLSLHIDGCAHCQGRLDKLTQATQGAVAKYQGQPSNEVTEKDQFASSAPDAGTHVLGALAPSQTPLLKLPSIPGFDVLEEIGRGGMSVVYKARHQRLNRLVALKMILAGVAADTRVVQRFLFEAEILARVKHPQVVQVFEVDTYRGSSGIPIPYLAMELLEGKSLSSHLQEERKKRPSAEGGNSLIEPHIAAELIQGVARAVHTAHLQGVIHRDLKPSNIVFASGSVVASTSSKTLSGLNNSTRSRDLNPLLSLLPKVTDFGLTRLSQEAGADPGGTSQAGGTPHYLAPEQVAGGSQVGPEADVHALGVILFECLTGRPPFEGSEPKSILRKVAKEDPPDVHSLCPRVDRDLSAIVMHCLEKDPKQRYASAADLADDLRRYLEKRPTVARPLNAWERFRLWAKRKHLWPE